MGSHGTFMHALRTRKHHFQTICGHRSLLCQL